MKLTYKVMPREYSTRMSKNLKNRSASLARPTTVKCQLGSSLLGGIRTEVYDDSRRGKLQSLTHSKEMTSLPYKNSGDQSKRDHVEEDS